MEDFNWVFAAPPREIRYEMYSNVFRKKKQSNVFQNRPLINNEMFQSKLSSDIHLDLYVNFTKTCSNVTLRG